MVMRFCTEWVKGEIWVCLSSVCPSECYHPRSKITMLFQSTISPLIDSTSSDNFKHLNYRFYKSRGSEWPHYQVHLIQITSQHHRHSPDCWLPWNHWAPSPGTERALSMWLHLPGRMDFRRLCPLRRGSAEGWGEVWHIPGMAPVQPGTDCSPEWPENLTKQTNQSQGSSQYIFWGLQTLQDIDCRF